MRHSKIGKIGDTSLQHYAVPTKGETRELLREKHGEEPAKLAVRHDSWMSETDAWSLLPIYVSPRFGESEFMIVHDSSC